MWVPSKPWNSESAFPLSSILEGAWEFVQPVHICFVDLEKAFDCFPWGVLWGVLQEYGVLGPLSRAAQSLYKWSESLAHIASCKSDSFSVRAGLRQGCSMSLILFIMFMDIISRYSQRAEGFHFSGLRIPFQLFVDDVVLLAPSGGDRFLHRVAGLSLRDRLHTDCDKFSHLGETMSRAAAPPHRWRSHLRWFGHLVRMPPGHLPGEVFWVCPTGRRPRGRPRTCWRGYVSWLVWEHLCVLSEELKEASGEREVWASLL